MIKRILMILVIMGLGVGMYFGIKLVNQNQDLRRSAANEKVTLTYTTVGSLDVGSTFRLVVTGSGVTEPGFGLINLKVSFDKDKLSLEKNNDGQYAVSLNSKFGTGFKKVDADNTTGVIDIFGIIDSSEEQLTGVVNPFVTFVFKVKSAGTATVSFLKDSDDYRIFGTDVDNNEINYDWENESYDLVLTTPATPVDWQTSDAYLKASDFYIETASGEKFYGKPSVGSVDVHSDPIGKSYRTTLEMIWTEFGDPMRLFVYFEAIPDPDSGQLVWRIYEMRTYDGSPTGEWLYVYNLFDVLTQLETPLKRISGVTIGLQTKNGDYGGKVYFENLEIMPNFLKSINLNPPLCIKSSIPLGDGVAPHTVVLHGAGNAGDGPGFTGYRWDFDNDGNWDTGVSIDPVTHTYSSPGVYIPKYQIYGSNDVWSDVCNYPYDVVVKDASGESSLLNFDFSFAGVRAGSKCVGNKKVTITVLKGDLRKEYKDVVVTATDEKNSKKETLFRVSNLAIADYFSDSTGLSVFVKGPKHLQMKFGIDDQSEFYNQAGGQIDVETGKVFDFSEYSLLAGDVNMDGTVDSIDFAEIKKKAAAHETTNEGEDSQYDLDGSCQVNTVDMALLVQSLNEKYDQVY